MDEEYNEIAQRLAQQVSQQLPGIINGLLQTGLNPEQPLQLTTHLSSGGRSTRSKNNHVRVASLEIGGGFAPLSSPTGIQDVQFQTAVRGALPANQDIANVRRDPRTWPATNTPAQNSPILAPDDGEFQPNKRLKRYGTTSIVGPISVVESESTSKDLITTNEDNKKVQHRKRTSDNPALQPSSLEKFINGIWDSLFSGTRMDPTEIIEEWRAIESSGQPKLLTDGEDGAVARRDLGAFGRMNILTRKISSTAKTFRSLEVLVQAYWVQCFDDRVTELSESQTRDKAKKSAISEACIDFNWTEKELRNKMAIWRGYHDIKNAAGWVSLVFAGTGLYRFSKYRVSFTDEAFETLKSLRHRFEVAADTLHNNWRMLLGIVGEATEAKYKGHHHDWVVNGPGNEAIPLRETYVQWDPLFTYEHLEDSIIDYEAWGHFDPRTVIADDDDPSAHKCQNCGGQQSNNPAENNCVCYSNLYGSPKAGMVPVQVFRAGSKNNGLIACCAFEKGWAVGEFVGEITTGIKGLDVMIDRTDRAGYQIWQGRKGNHTRFVNHSCEPNAHYERFVWLGKQRSVLVSDSIDAGEEITVDYGDTYWEDLDKACLCNKPNCRYRRGKILPNSEQKPDKG